MSGLIDRTPKAIDYTGTVRFIHADGTENAEGSAESPVAVVFQNFALLDELSPIQNVRIAIDHTYGRSSEESSEVQAREYLDELRVPTDRPTAVLSGGQRQRLAIARAVAMETDVIFYDEPTSGLDVNTATQVAELIQETHRKFSRTSIIVTHDYEALSRIANRIYVLDHHRHRLLEVAKEEWGRLPEVLGTPPNAREENVAVHRKTLIARTSGMIRRAAVETGAARRRCCCCPGLCCRSGEVSFGA